MKRYSVLAAIGLAWGVSAALAAEGTGHFPSETIQSGPVKMLIYLPDADKGFYRSTRFDWSGMIGRVEYKGHSFYAPWKETHDPVLGTDDVIGPTEEYGMQVPLGYPQAAVGETFIKIGVGHLQKIEEARYRFFQPYKIVKPGTWRITRGDDFVRFEQNLGDDRGFGYRYVKRVAVLADPPGFVIDHTLKNTGTKVLETNQYNHNFTMIDDEKIGRNYRLTLGFEPVLNQTEKASLQGILKIEGRDITFTGEVQKDKPIWARMDGFKTAADHLMIIRNTRTGAAVKITGDLPMSRWCLYVAERAICPEPFIQIKLESGAEQSWRTRYELLVEK